MKIIARVLASLILAITFSDAYADCLSTVNEGKILEKLVSLDNSYGDVPSTIQCFNKKSKSEELICSSQKLLAMELLDSKSYVYGVENGTKSEVNHKKVKDSPWVRTVRNKCNSMECLCEAFKKHTEESLGDSPYK